MSWKIIFAKYTNSKECISPVFYKLQRKRQPKNTQWSIEHSKHNPSGQYTCEKKLNPIIRKMQIKIVIIKFFKKLPQNSKTVKMQHG